MFILRQLCAWFLTRLEEQTPLHSTDVSWIRALFEWRNHPRTPIFPKILWERFSQLSILDWCFRTPIESAGFAQLVYWRMNRISVQPSKYFSWLALEKSPCLSWNHPNLSNRICKLAVNFVQSFEIKFGCLLVFCLSHPLAMFRQA
jgi:hypothetical protein